MGHPPAFDEVRMQAWKILRQVEDSQAFADFSLDQTFAKNPHWRPLDRAFLVELVLGTLRWQGRIDLAILHASQYPDKKMNSQLLQILRLGAYQILFLDRVPDSAAVNESVRLAKAIFKNEKMSAFVNALLRTISRKKNQEGFPPFASHPTENIAQTFSHPLWMVESWVKDFGPELTREICAANNLRPPFTVRVNTLKTSRKILKEKFNVAGIHSFPTPFSPEGLVLEKSPFLAEDELFRQGMYFVQDESSQIIAHLLAPRPGERVLDVCAAPGGKATHLSQLMQDRGEIIAMDLHTSKMKIIGENCRRLGISIIQTLPTDATRPLPFPAQLTFDRILLDAPCTGLGVLHRNPEVKWRRKPQDALRLQKLQMALLESVCSRLKKGGILVYSTCTMTREENDSVVEAFLNKHKDFQVEDLSQTVPDSWRLLLDEKGFLRTYPKRILPREDYRMDGFFAARMKKKT
jgi:16S rRNA (cytosine967-C5)-methyltransferase